jgi:hypothetical protein
MADTVKVLSDHATPATVVLIGVADSVDALIGEHQSIERALVQVNMPRMSDAEIEQIVKTGVTRLGMTVDQEALDEIKSLSQGMPYVTHLLSLHIVRAALEDQSFNVALPHVESRRQAVGQGQACGNRGQLTFCVVRTRERLDSRHRPGLASTRQRGKLMS